VIRHSTFGFYQVNRQGGCATASLIKKNSADLAVKKSDRSIWRKNRNYCNRRKKNRKIRQTLLKNFQPDLAENFSGRLCPKNFNRTLDEKSQSPPHTLFEMIRLSNQILLKYF